MGGDGPAHAHGSAENAGFRREGANANAFSQETCRRSGAVGTGLTRFWPRRKTHLRPHTEQRVGWKPEAGVPAAGPRPSSVSPRVPTGSFRAGSVNRRRVPWSWMATADAVPCPCSKAHCSEEVSSARRTGTCAHAWCRVRGHHTRGHVRLTCFGEVRLDLLAKEDGTRFLHYKDVYLELITDMWEVTLNPCEHFFQ